MSFSQPARSRRCPYFRPPFTGSSIAIAWQTNHAHMSHLGLETRDALPPRCSWQFLSVENPLLFMQWHELSCRVVKVEFGPRLWKFTSCASRAGLWLWSCRFNPFCAGLHNNVMLFVVRWHASVYLDCRVTWKRDCTGRHSNFNMCPVRHGPEIWYHVVACGFTRCDSH